MKCFNCGDDADMKVLIMLNGKLQQVDICSDCYKEQLGEMVQHFKGENGEFNPEEMQKFMFKLMSENKEEFENIFGNLLNEPDFNLDDIDFDNISVEINDIPDNIRNFEDFKKHIEGFGIEEVNFKHDDFAGHRHVDPEQINFHNRYKENENKEVKMLQNSVDKKKKELNHYVQIEDYMTAATLRDQIRDINKRIMIILELEKENER